ncbi:Cell adhesion molecule /down-regulated by oncogene [Fasciola gigantica]|uniref:Cell adhesion molecule /down-regulated by oncogene n=1 Tax=Fasciola gigantica TaxID=46835 RepID=A0A504YP97_FASGI|nr:Cell adhesion molecule /down-regulated by oncogene [Fasciola gigantica]
MSTMDSRNLSLWKNWMLRLFILSGMACWCMPNVQIVPKFTSVPPSVSYFVPSATEPDPVDLICRAWPPNAKLYLLATQLPAPIQLAEHIPSSSAGADASVPRANSALLSIPPGLASQRYAVLTATQLSAAQSENRPVPESSLRPVIIHETLVDAIRERPAAAPSDEVAVRLTVTNLADVRQLELMRLHCLVATAFGRLLSSPFHVIPTSLGDFPQPAVSTGQGNMPSPLRYSVEFLSNNIAVVDCHLPLNSFPIPTVQFELNGTVLDTAGVHADRYRQVLRHDRRRVSLLIHKVQAHDQGVYRCVVTNRLTGEKKYSPEETHLKLVELITHCKQFGKSHFMAQKLNLLLYNT